MVGPVVLGLAVAAAVLIVLTEVTNLIVIDVSGAGCEDAVADPVLSKQCEVTGGDQHSYALVAVALLVVVMGVGAGLGRSRPAGFALVAAGVVVLGIALIGDLPDTTKTGEVGLDFSNAHADPGPAFWFEIVGAALSIAAGGLRLLVRPRRAT